MLTTYVQFHELPEPAICANLRRTYPYLQPELWIADLEEERQRQRTHGPHEPYTYEL